MPTTARWASTPLSEVIEAVTLFAGVGRLHTRSR
jgi:hypothetical protein